MGINCPWPGGSGFFGMSGNGSNLRIGANPAYAVTDFLSIYPQFGENSQSNYVVPEAIIQQFINMATASIQQVRWRSAWYLAMAWFIAHYCTLYLETYVDPDNGAGAVFEAGRAQGVTTGESAGDVSFNVDVNVGSVDGWGHWNSTEYGRQLANRGKTVGMGGMYVW